jgi:small subunit ribosomal protein S21
MRPGGNWRAGLAGGWFSIAGALFYSIFEDRCAIHCLSDAGGGIYLAHVQVKDNEPLDVLLRRFKKKIEETGILKEAKRHEHYEKPSDRRRRSQAARRRKIRAELDKAR